MTSLHPLGPAQRLAHKGSKCPCGIDYDKEMHVANKGKRREAFQWQG